MGNNKLDEKIKRLNKLIDEEPESLYMFTLKYYSLNDINYIVDRLHLDEDTREKFRKAQHEMAVSHQESEQKEKAWLLREQKLSETFIKFDKQANTILSISDRTMMLDTILVSINQLIHDPVINPISPIEAAEINAGLEYFFTSTYFKPDEIHYVIDHLDLKEKENFREEIRKEQIAKELARTMEVLRRERKEERRKQIAEKAQQFIADPSTTLVAISEFLKGFYSQLPYKIDEHDLYHEINHAIEEFKINSNNLDTFVDSLDLNRDSREAIKDTQKNRFDHMRSTRQYDLSSEIEKIRRNNPDTMVRDIISVIHKEMNHPIIPLTRDEIGSILDGLASQSFTFLNDSRNLHEDNSDLLPLTMREVAEIRRGIGLQTSVRNVAALQVEDMTNYAGYHLPQFLPTDIVCGNSQELLNLASHKNEFKTLITESISKMETKGESAIQPELSTLTSSEKKKVLDKLKQYSEKREKNRTEIDKNELQKQKERTEKLQKARSERGGEDR